jgi:hypothetical protein
MAMLTGLGVTALKASNVLQEMVLPVLDKLAKDITAAESSLDSFLASALGGSYGDATDRIPLALDSKRYKMQSLVMSLLTFPIAAGLLRPDATGNSSFASANSPAAQPHRPAPHIFLPSSVVPSTAQVHLMKQLVEVAVLVTLDGRLVRAPKSISPPPPGVLIRPDVEHGRSCTENSEVYLPLELGGEDFERLSAGFPAEAGLTFLHPDYARFGNVVPSSSLVWLFKYVCTHATDLNV